MQYYNTKTKEIAYLNEIKRKLNMSIPQDTDRVGDYVRVVRDPVSGMPEKEYAGFGHVVIGETFIGDDGLAHIPAVYEYFPVDQIKRNMKDYISQLRFDVEEGGLDNDGSLINTALADQNRLTATVSLIQMSQLAGAPIKEVDFKGAEGWVKLPADLVIGIGLIVGKFVESCFTAERKLHEAVDAASTREELEAIDCYAPWDPRSLYIRSVGK